MTPGRSGDVERDLSKADLADLADRVGELSGEVAAIRKQVVEQMIKTTNALGNLSAEVKTFGRQHQQQRRGINLNSAAAYVLFVALVAAGFYFVYRSQVERFDAEKAALVREHAAAQTKLAAMRKTEERRREAEGKAAAFYRLSQSGRVRQALRQYPEVAQLPLSRVEAAVFQDWAGKTRNRLAHAAHAAGMQAVGEKSYKRAVSEFRSALAILPHPSQEATLRYYLGISLMKLGSYKEAAAELEAALGVDAEKTVSKEIRYYLGTIYEQVARRDRAINAYQGYIKRFPNTPYARAARRRLRALK